MAVPIFNLGAPGILLLFLQGNLHAHKCPRFRGIFCPFFVGEVPILLYGRGNFGKFDTRIWPQNSGSRVRIPDFDPKFRLFPR